MKNLVFINVERMGNVLAEVPRDKQIQSGERLLVSRALGTREPSFEAMSQSDSMLMGDDAAKWIIGNLNPRAIRYYVKGINHTEMFIW